MGATSSKPGEEGIITVNPSSATAAASSNSNKPGPGSSSAATQVDPLLHHLQELQSKIPKVDATSFSSKPADPESLLADVEIVKQLSHDTGALNGAVNTLFTTYQAWHNENIKALTTNQEYIARTIDQAEAKADKAVRHVQLQTSRLKTLTAGLEDAAALPALLDQLTANTAVLQEQLQQLELQVAAQQQQQQQQHGGTAATGARSSSSKTHASPTSKQQRQQQQQQKQ